MRPVAAEFDRNPDPIDCIPTDVVEEGSKIGLRTLALTEEHGGGADMLTLSIVGEELGAGDLGVAATFDQTWKFTPIIEHWTNDEQKERFLRRSFRITAFIWRRASPNPTPERITFCPTPPPARACR